MAFGVFDPATSELSLASAGFPAPFLVRNGKAGPVDVAGVPLGLLPDSTYEAVCLRLQPGDTVVFCSDGVCEQTNATEEEFGTDRLVGRLAASCESAAAAEIASEVLKAVTEHAAGTASRPPGDDRTIVVLRVTA